MERQKSPSFSSPVGCRPSEAMIDIGYAVRMARYNHGSNQNLDGVADVLSDAERLAPARAFGSIHATLATHPALGPDRYLDETGWPGRRC